jgi:uncharacterized protein
VIAYFIVACGFTWLLAAPLALAWLSHEPPAPYALACAGLSAFGPLLAAFLVAGRERRLREVFGSFWANPAWIALALFAPMAIHVLAAVLSALVGAAPARWFHPPSAPEQWAALVVFSIGEEFGWRGFAHPRLVGRYGMVKGSLTLGGLWAIWHLAYAITPAGEFEPFLLAMLLIQLPLCSLLIAWVFERANRSMAVAIAFHAGGHLDRIDPGARTELPLHAMHLAVLAVLAVFAARSLVKHRAP